MSTTALDSSVTLDEVFAVVATKRVPLAPELAGYLALELAEHADPVGGDVDPKSVFVGDEGTVALVKPRREAAYGNAEASIRAALARLLDASGSQTPALAAASRRKSGSGLPALAEELEAALIPVNRAAARRALARLAREVKRVTLGVGRAALPSTSDAAPPSRRASSPSYTPAPARVSATAPDAFAREEEPTTTRAAVPDDVLRKAAPEPRSVSESAEGPATASPEAGSAERENRDSDLPTVEFTPTGRPSPSQADVDALIAKFGVSGDGETPHTGALKAMAGLDPTPPPREAGSKRERSRIRGASDDSELDALLQASSATPSQPRSSAVDERQLPTQPSKLRQRGSLPGATPARARRARSRVLLVVAVAAIAAGVFAVWQLRPSARVGDTAQTPSGQAHKTAPPAPTACKGTLVVTDVPPHAEVLMREGQAPVDVEKMPVGTRLEFVATAEGFAPKRVVVPAGATWDPAPDGKPRLEVAVQLDKSHAHPGTNDPWPAGEPGSTVGGKGPPGTVHVVATPRGAEVWLLAGIGPEARVEQVSCDQDVDVLLAGPTIYRKRLHVPVSAFTAENGDNPGAEGGSASPMLARVSAK